MLTDMLFFSLLDDSQSSQYPQMGICVSNVLRSYATLWTHLCRPLHHQPVRKGQAHPQTMALESDIRASRLQYWHCHHASLCLWF